MARLHRRTERAPSQPPDLEVALAAIERWGLLLLSDPTLPSLVALIAGEPVRGSWWGHPAGSRIFSTAGALDDSPDVATFKLVSSKVCFVHRRLWRALSVVGRAREPWQTDGLDDGARALLARVDAEGQVRASGKPAKTIEARLLVASEQVHTERGTHATELIGWPRFLEVREVENELPSLEQAKAELEAAARALGDAHGVAARLPWNARSARR